MSMSFISEEDRYYLKISYSDEFIGVFSHNRNIFNKEMNEKLYNSIVGKIKNIYIHGAHGFKALLYPLKNDNPYLLYNLDSEELKPWDGKLSMRYSYLEIEFSKKDFAKLKLLFS